MTTQPITIVYSDSNGITRSETALCASSAMIRAEELEAAGYTVIDG